MQTAHRRQLVKRMRMLECALAIYMSPCTHDVFAFINAV
jgi:hypothetical protein